MRRLVFLLMAILAASTILAQPTEDALHRRLERILDRILHARIGIVEREFGIGDGTSFVPLQISFAPGLAIPFGYYDVGLSVGVIGALTRDVSGIAGASVFNLSRDIQGAQAAGVFNLGENVQGVQSAGVFNIASGDVQGAQLAGVFNIASGRVEGTQLAGVFNIANDVDGFQAAGVFNIAENYNGPLQTAGVFTIATNIDGVQASGIANIADRVRGAQFASIVNVAQRVEGLQVGLVNIATHIDGVQLGLVNISRNGVGGVGGLFEPQSGYSWAFWQNGTPYFYTVFMAGMPQEDWSIRTDRLIGSAGAGSRLNLGRTYVDIELAALQEIGPAISSLEAASFSNPLTKSGMMALGSTLGQAANAVSHPWGAIRLSFGVPVLWRLHFVGGVRIDLDLDDNAVMPESLRTGLVSSGNNVLGIRFTSYTKWFFGFRI